MIRTILLCCLPALCAVSLTAQEATLPPAPAWTGESEALIVGADDPWQTPAEAADFVTTPDYATTVAWLEKLTAASDLFTMVSIGRSAEGRDIWMVVASTDADVSPAALRASAKPLLLAQAGIHSGEIDGKDAGLMLLRDIAFGDRGDLLAGANFLFIPILNVDGHENASPYHRPNQRGPENMGWRTNSRNLNLNRDYAKLDTREIRAVVNVINTYDPALYLDIHVTDGADYQYDITYSGNDVQGNSPAIAAWLGDTFKPAVDAGLTAAGHIPGPLMFAVNDRDFTEGNVSVAFGPRFSDSYGILRHLPTVLVENHSLKPYRQRVLGTYVFLDHVLQVLAAHGDPLRAAVAEDRALRPDTLPMAYAVPQVEDPAAAPAPDSMQLLGIASRLRTSPVTGGEYIEWLGTPVTESIAYLKETVPVKRVARPAGYYVPVYCAEIIDRLAAHGIRLDTLAAARTEEVELYRITDPVFGGGTGSPFEEHVMVSGTPVVETRTESFPAGSVYVTTDQPLGDLAMALLEPASDDSFLSWGFLLNIFQRTEYIEGYVLEPLAQRMLAEDPALRAAFEEKKRDDPAFAENPRAMMTWFYARTPYYDARYQLYPVGRVK